MIILNGTNEQIERLKAKAGIMGDVYLVRDHLMESLSSHKTLFPESTATTIEEAEAERIAYENELDELRAQQVAEAQAQQEQENNEESDDPNEDEESETNENE